jgi:hypothetical protein
VGTPPSAPAGTGFDWYKNVTIPADEPPPTEEELEREMEYFVDPPSLAGQQRASYGEASP